MFGSYFMLFYYVFMLTTQKIILQRGNIVQQEVQLQWIPI